MNLRPEYIVDDAGGIPKSLPKPVKAKKQSKPIDWKPIINDVYGQVIKVIDKNYGLAASYVPLYDDSDECKPCQVLFEGRLGVPEGKPGWWRWPR